MNGDRRNDSAEPMLIDSKAAAALLGISTRKLWELKTGGQIPHVSIGRAVRYATADLQAWIAAHTHRGQHHA